MTVDQSGRQSCAFGIDDQGRAIAVDVLLFADRHDLSIDRNYGIRIENWALQITAQHKTNIPDHKPRLRLAFNWLIVGHEGHLFLLSVPRSSVVCKQCYKLALEFLVSNLRFEAGRFQKLETSNLKLV